MGKTKGYEKIVDAAAKIITWHDESQIKFDKGLVNFVQLIVNVAAATISIHDNVQARLDRLLLITQYNVAKFLHSTRIRVEGETKKIMGHITGILLIALALVSIFHHSIGYQYSYNGRELGYVKDQGNVIRILGLVNDQLSQEHGYKVNISEDSDIEFEPVFVLNKEVDNADTVLKRFTYMSDTRAESYAIYIDGNKIVSCKSEDYANKILDSIKDEYIDEKDDVQYLETGFVEKVEIKKETVKLKYISSLKDARKKILTGGVGEVTHTIKSGDTVSTLCQKYDISAEELRKMNPEIKDDLLIDGHKLVISKAIPLLKVKTVSKEKYAEKIKYKTIIKESDSMYNTEKKVSQEGSNGKKAVVAEVTRINGEKVKAKEISSKIITEVVDEIIIKGTKEPPKTAATGSLINPAPSFRVSSTFGPRWGRMHTGVDFAGPVGTSIRAADGGTVVEAGWHGSYGINVVIDHGNGMKTRYAHNSQALVSPGTKVYKGQIIAKSGNTGRSTGPHCHFEVMINGVHQNPFNYL